MVSSEASNQIFDKLKNDPENDKCIECGALHPEYTSVNHGAFICSSCIQYHMPLGQTISRIKSINEQWSLEELKLMTAGGNSALKEFFNHYNILSAPPSFKYCTRAGFFYREMLSVIAEDNIYDQNCPGIEEGVELVARINYPDLPLEGFGIEDSKINVEEPLVSGESKKKSPWDKVRDIYFKAVDVGNKTVDRLSEKINKLAEKPAIKKVETTTVEIVEKIESGFNFIVDKVVSKPAVQESMNHVENAADSFAREVKFTYNKINANPSVNKMKNDTMNMLRDFGLIKSEPAPNNSEPTRDAPSDQIPLDLIINDNSSSYVPPPYVPPPYVPPQNEEVEKPPDSL